jgi:hypothetical protein
VSTPTARITAAAASRSSWYSSSASVICGATVTESPVCTPIGSRFSIEQTTTTLSARSRTTSSSNSSQPRTDSSTSTWAIGDSDRPISTWRRSSASVATNPPPWPPSVKAGRTTAGRDTPSRLSSEVTILDVGTASPTDSTASRNRSRSSARRIASSEAPISTIPSSSRMPASASSRARLSAVCPPIVGSSASGRSRASTPVTPSRSRGSRYVRSANPGSVMIVAGFELTTTVRKPSSRSTFSACEPA